MNIEKLKRMVRDGDLSVQALKNLIGFRAECQWLDYKVELDISRDKQLCDFARDALAMRNSGGGYMLVGVRDKTWEPIGMEQPLALDAKLMKDKLKKVLGLRLEVVVVNHLARVEGRPRWFTIILVPVPDTSESSPELEFVSRDYRADEKYGLVAGWTYVRNGDETTRVTTGRQFEIARINLGKAVGDANYYRRIERLSREVDVNTATLSGLIEGSSQSIVEIEGEDTVAVFSQEPDRRVLSSPKSSTVPGANASHPVVINLNSEGINTGIVDKLRQVLKEHPGSSPVHLQIRGPRSTMAVRLGDEYSVDPRSGLYAEIKVVLGDTLLS